ncbi:MAG: hypothetical protein IPI79_10920 [Moraxellaceae bacterium]|nr:hypothetical protein [Moraxellaceae bacterium]MBK7300793.1 hypothetical protein [Moraxellaceae bacterium]MBK8327721.1 hypothetical protein [Moraxellaceae bacterium]MBK9185589.1 hypothetical protein [Moraxellaceae bacterium]MBL0230852.1 hypothetical protein [Moraxellaceae bacterium]
MNLEKVIFAFFIVLAATLNFGFFLGDIERPELHHVGEFSAALIINLIATTLKFGDRSHMGATQLATSLAATLQLVAAAMFWGYQTQVVGGMTPTAMAGIVSLAGGAMLANFVSLILLIAETVMFRR